MTAAPYRLPTLQRVPDAIIGLAFLGLVFFLMTSSVVLAPPGSSVAAWWPAAGVSVAAVLWAPRRRLWVMALGIAATSFAANAVGGRPAALAAGFAVANTAEAVTVALMLGSGGSSKVRLATMDDLARFVRAAAVGSALIGAIAGLSVWLFVDGDGFGTARAASASHGAAQLIVLPCFLATTATRGRSRAEVVGQWVVVVAVTSAVFAPHQDLPLAFAPFVPLMWGAVRMGQRTVSLQLLAVGIIASMLTSASGGPFGHLYGLGSLTPETVTALVQAFLVCSALMVLPLSVAVRQRQEAMAELARSEALFRHGFTEALLGMLLLRRVGTQLRIVELNEVAERLLGDAPDSEGSPSLLGHSWTELLPRPTQDAVASALAEMATGHVSGWHGETSLEGQDDRWLEVTLSPLGTQDADLYTAQLVDVTQRTLANERLRSALDTERRAVEQLTELDRAKNDFVATISHELRTPITSVIGYAEMLALGDAGDLEPTQQGMVEKVQRNAERLLSLIEDVLTVSRLEAGSFQLAPEAVDLSAAVRRAVDAVETQVSERDLGLEVAAPPVPVQVTGDREQLERVVINLLSNAVKFTPPGGRLGVSLSTTPTHALVSVEDTGLGIPPDEAHRLFERFFRSSTAQDHAIQGTGLGLSIVNNIVRLHQGEVHYRPRPGGGSVFEVRLPLMRSDESARVVVAGSAHAFGAGGASS